MRGFKKSNSLTPSAGFLDKRSFVSLDDATGTPHLVLYGMDVATARERAIKRATDEYGYLRCQYPRPEGGICGEPISDYLHEMDPKKAHMRHVTNKPRCWCDHNLEMVSLNCHKRDHPDGRLGNPVEGEMSK